MMNDSNKIYLLEPKIKQGKIKGRKMASTAVFTFGRFNPPTVGHQKMIQKLFLHLQF